MLEEQFFDPKVHDRNGFHSGVPVLDAFLRKYAAQLDAAPLSLADQRKLPRYAIACFRLGRLARDIGSRGKGIGKVLMGLAVDRCRKAKVAIGAYALLVDAN